MKVITAMTAIISSEDGKRVWKIEPKENPKEYNGRKYTHTRRIIYDDIIVACGMVDKERLAEELVEAVQDVRHYENYYMK